MPHTPIHIAFQRPWPTTRRGLKLWLLAIVLGLKGIGYIRGATPDSTESGLRIITEGLNVPLQVCGGVIVALCAFAAFCSYCHMGRDRYGYMVLTGFCFAWAAAFAVSPLFLDGPDYAFQGALSYVLIGAFLLISAADPEPAPFESVVSR